MIPDKTTLIDAAQVANMCRLSPITIQRAIKAGELVPVIAGVRGIKRYFDRADVDAWFAKKYMHATGKQ